jgi:hypothetical protein
MPREALHVEANTQEEASGVSSCDRTGVLKKIEYNFSVFN